MIRSLNCSSVMKNLLIRLQISRFSYIFKRPFDAWKNSISDR